MLKAVICIVRGRLGPPIQRAGLVAAPTCKAEVAQGLQTGKGKGAVDLKRPVVNIEACERCQADQAVRYGAA